MKARLPQGYGKQSQQHYSGIPHKRLFFHAHSPSQTICFLS